VFRTFRSWWKKDRRQPVRVARYRCRRVWLERLEDRTLLSGNTLATATPLTLTPVNNAQAGNFLSSPSQVDLYSVPLNSGAVLNTGVTAQTAGSGLQSSLAVFNSSGQQVALNAQQGGDPNLTFQAPASGTYYVGVSSAGNTGYDPTTGTNVNTGTTTGLYTLNATVTSNVTLTPDLTGQNLSVSTDTVTLGGNVSMNFTIGNQGGAAAGNFTVNVEASSTNLFDPASTVVLQNLTVPGLAPGASYTTSNLTVTLPDAATAAANNLPTSGPLFLGTQIVPTDAVPQLDPYAQVAAHAGLDWQQVQVVTPVTASGTNLSSTTADPLANLNSQVSGTLGANQANWYQVTVPDTGNLTATVSPAAGTDLAPQVTLYGPDGQTTLVQSNAASTSNPNPSLVLNLQPGTYYLAAAGQSGTGSYQLTTTFTAGSSLTQAIQVGGQPTQAVVADFNNDGHLDVAISGASQTATSPSVTVLLGNGDGTFQVSQTIDLVYGGHYVAVANLTGDGIPDLVVTNSNYNATTKTFGPGTVSVLLGNGDGTFQVQPPIPVGTNPAAVTVADFNGDGIPDLAVSNDNYYNPATKSYGPGSVSILLGNGNGTFTPAPTLSVGLHPGSLAAADLNGDGIPDLVVPYYGPANVVAGKVSVFMGNGNGTFQAPVTYAAGPRPSAVTVADLKGNGVPDLVVTNYVTNGGVSILLGNGNGSFSPASTYFGIANPSPGQVADVNGDGKLDIVFGYELGTSVGALLGNGNGTFSPAVLPTPSAGLDPNSVVVADFNGDGRPDLVVADAADVVISGPVAAVGTPANSGTVTVLLGDGDGFFQNQAAFSAGSFPVSVAAGDLTGNGIQDLVVANRYSGTVSVLLGNGDGSFQNATNFNAGPRPTSVAIADLNGDGRPDLVVTNYYYRAASKSYVGTVDVLLGNGDGTFQAPQSLAAGPNPHSVAVADLTGNGIQDLVVTNEVQNGTISVLMGYGNGTFRTAQSFAAGPYPYHVAVADLNGDGIPDVAVTNYVQNGTVSLLLGNNDGTGHGTGTFTLAPTPIPVGAYPGVIVAADLNGDHNPDLAVNNNGSGTVSVLLGSGNGTFTPAGPPIAVGNQPSGLVVADFNGDNIPDLVVGSAGTGTASLLLGNGNGTFQAPQTIYTNVTFLTGMVAADFNGDGRPDLALSDGIADTVNVLLGTGNGTFAQVTPANGLVPNNTPYLADLNGTPDEVILDGAGNILFRAGVPGSPGLFAPPVTLNPGQPARAVTVVSTGTGYAIAAAGASASPDLSTPNNPVYTISLYTVAADGSMSTPSTVFTTSFLPTQIATADLNGTGLGDLVVANGLNNSVSVAMQTAPGQFSTPVALPVGGTPSAIAFTSNGDIVVTDQASGTVTLLPNQTVTGSGTPSFGPGQVYAATTAPLGTVGPTAAPVIGSENLLLSLAVGNFTGRGLNDLAILDNGTDSISVLPGDSSGGFVNPQASLAFSSDNNNLLENPSPVGPVVAGTFNQNSNLTDLAVLMAPLLLTQDEVAIYTNQGNGTFSQTETIGVTGQASGLNLVPGSAPGLFNILVGDPQGDILTLVGQGNGTFQPPPSFTGDNVPLSVQTGLLQGGQPGVLVANQAANNVSLQTAPAGSTQFTPVNSLSPTNTADQLAPGAVQWADLNGNSSLPSAVVAGTGSNDILVYPTTGTAGNLTIGTPTPYFVGTQPVSVTVQDINGDGVPDILVSNYGSNTVSILFGSIDSTTGQWVGTPGPTLNTHGSGPTGVTVQQTGSGNPNLLVTNAQSGTLTVLPGVGQGFFNDQASAVTTVGLGTSVTQAPVVVGTTGELVMPTTSGGLIGVNTNDLSAPVQTILPAAPPGAGVAALATLPDGSLVAALQNGTVEQFAFDATTGTLGAGQELTPLTGVPTDPNALAALPTPTGTEVLVTSAGEDQLFVFGLEAGGGGGSAPGSPGAPGNPSPPPTPPAPEPPPLGPSPPGPPVTVGQPSPEAPLVLVVTLQAASPAEGGPELPPPQAEEAAVVAAPAAAEANAPAAPAIFLQGDQDADAQAAELAWAGDEVVPRVDDALRDLHLQPRIDEDLPDLPLSLLQIPGLDSDQVIVGLFPASTEAAVLAGNGLGPLAVAQVAPPPLPAVPAEDALSSLMASPEDMAALHEGLTWRTLFPTVEQDEGQSFQPPTQPLTGQEPGLEAVHSLAPELKAGQGLGPAQPCDWLQASLVALAANGISWWATEAASRLRSQAGENGDLALQGGQRGDDIIA
jgi:hypothetical protein